MMRILADENVEPVVVQWLRSLGYEVASICQQAPGINDDDVLALARSERRVLITYDLDFGEIVYRRGMKHTGIILLRLSDPTPTGRLASLQRHWHLVEPRLPQAFIVVHDKKVRVRPLPP